MLSAIAENTAGAKLGQKMKKFLQGMRRELRAHSDGRIRDQVQRYFKEEVKAYGIKTAAVMEIGKKYLRSIKDRGKHEIFAACGELWRSGYLEESGIACIWAYSVRKEFEPEDLSVFEGWIGRHVTNWASCDTLCNHTVGALLESYPERLADMKKWARSGNRWMRRASAVSLIVPARKGMFLREVLAIADILLTDDDDMVQKGYGWMLKVASQARQKEVFDYVMKRKDTMPRTALRYAIEKMPKGLKARAMAR
jgi:3-methyladenine DNA glycosylase AlkD